MSGHSDCGPCPKCGSEMTKWYDYDQVSGECTECGFYYYTKDGFQTLEEVNELRENIDLKPLKKLREVT